MYFDWDISSNADRIVGLLLFLVVAAVFAV